jgi:biotin operon repressor
MNLLDYIPTGKDNAVTRPQLCKLTGMSDRKVREQISQLRRDHVIINDQSGKGYYRSNDRAEIERYVRQETARLKSIGWSLKAARKALS